MNDVGATLAESGFVCLADETGLNAVRGLLGRQGATEVLTAREAHQADAWSLSGTYGRKSFPWHTDGAVSTKPPRWVLLKAIKVEKPTRTELLRPRDTTLAELKKTVLLVTTQTGTRRYLPAYMPEPHGYRLRWDPRVCQPKFGLSNFAMTERPTAVIEWSQGDAVLFDNAQLLHRRPDVTEDGERVLERTYFWDM